MIIPVKCPTCGEVLADKYEYFVREVRKQKIERGKSLERTEYFSKENTKKTVEGDVMDALKLNSVCCRRVMLTHVDLK
jgi:DNA-directed RNA polymerase I, II, and III subunit RPABC5